MVLSKVPGRLKHMQKFLSRLNFLSKYLLAAVLIIIVLYPKFPFINIPGTYVAIRLEDFLLFILAIVTFIGILSGPKKFFSDKIIMSFVVFFIAGAVSLAAAVLITKSAALTIGSLHLLRRVEYVLPLFAIFALFSKDQSSKNLDFYIKIIIIIVSIVFLYGVGQRYFNFPIVDTQNDEYSKGIALLWTPGAHINSTFAGHYDLAAFVVLILPIFSTLFFLTKNLKLKYLSLAVVLAGLWLLGASLSRVSLISWVIASSLPLFILKKYKGIFFIVIAAGIVVLLFPSLLGRYQRFLNVYAADTATNAATPLSNFTPTVVTTPPPALVNEDRSTSIRLNVEWPAALRAFFKNPLLGTGYSSIGLAADNDYLRALAEVGFLGLAAFALIFVRIGQEILRFLKQKDKFSVFEQAFLLGFLGSVIGTFATALFIDIFEASKFATIFWLFAGYAVFLIRSKTYEH